MSNNADQINTIPELIAAAEKAQSGANSAELQKAMREFVDANPQVVALLTKLITSDVVRVAETESPEAVQREKFKKLSQLYTDATDEEIEAFYYSDEYDSMVIDFNEATNDQMKKPGALQLTYAEIMFAKLVKSAQRHEDFQIIFSGDEYHSAQSTIYNAYQRLEKDPLKKYKKEFDIVETGNANSLVDGFYSHDPERIYTLLYNLVLLRSYREGSLPKEVNESFTEHCGPSKGSYCCDNALRIVNGSVMWDRTNEPMDEELLEVLKQKAKELIADFVPLINNSAPYRLCVIDDSDLLNDFDLKRTPEGGFEVASSPAPDEEDQTVKVLGLEFPDTELLEIPRKYLNYFAHSA